MSWTRCSQEFCAGVFHLPGSRSAVSRGQERPARRGSICSTRSPRSCDVYFYGLASTIGVDRIAAFMAPFGYGAADRHRHQRREARPAALARVEAKSTSSDPQDQVWFPGETVNFGVGQGYLLVTPLQLAHVASVLAERGKSFRPRLVIGMRDGYGHITPIAPVADPPDRGHQRRRLGPGAAAACTAPRAANRRHGGHLRHRGAAIQGRGLQAAGKTGTAQVFTVSRSERLIAERTPSGCATTPGSSPSRRWKTPRIAVAVLVENGGFGASAAAPIARKVMDAYLLRQSTRPGAAARASGDPAASPRSSRLRAMPLIEDTGYRAHAPHALGLGAAAARRSISTGRCWSAWACLRSTAWSFSTAPRGRASTPSCAR